MPGMTERGFGWVFGRIASLRASVAFFIKSPVQTAVVLFSATEKMAITDRRPSEEGFLYEQSILLP